MTTVYPRATWREVTNEASDPSIIPVGIILHSSGGEAESLFGWFNGPSGGIESHLHIARDPKPGGGGIEQYRDLDNEADANYHGNSWVSGGRRYGFLSVETQGTGFGPWTAYQVEEIAQFIAWCSKRYGFPIQQCRGPKDPGVGWHIMWGAPGEWTPVNKICPGPQRIGQVPVVLARARAIATHTEPQQPEKEDDDMKALLVRYQGAQYVVTPELTNKTGIRNSADLRALSESGNYVTCELSESTMAAIPTTGGVIKVDEQYDGLPA